MSDEIELEWEKRAPLCKQVKHPPQAVLCASTASERRKFSIQLNVYHIYKTIDKKIISIESERWKCLSCIPTYEPLSQHFSMVQNSIESSFTFFMPVVLLALYCISQAVEYYCFTLETAATTTTKTILRAMMGQRVSNGKMSIFMPIIKWFDVRFSFSWNEGQNRIVCVFVFLFPFRAISPLPFKQIEISFIRVFFSCVLFPSVGYYGHSHNSALYEAEPNFSRKSIDIEHVSFQTNVDGIKRQLKQNTVPMCGESEMSALMPTKYTVTAAIRYV